MIHPSTFDLDPIKQLQALHASGHGLTKQQADAYLSRVAEDRKLGFREPLDLPPTPKPLNS